MRLHLSQSLVLLSFISHLPTVTVASGFDGLSKCALDCFGTSLTASFCVSLQNISCLCSDSHYRLEVAQCLSTTCTPKQTLSAFNATASACGEPVRDKSGYAQVTNIALFVFAMCAVIARCASQITYRQFHALCDVTTGVIVALDLTLVIWIHFLLRKGLGRDIWTIPFDNITQVIFRYWVGEMLYLTVTWLVRIEFLMFFFRIFPERRFRMIIWGVVTIYVAAMTATVFAIAFVCTPVSFLWNSWDGEHRGHCIDHNAVVYAQAALVIMADLVTFAMAVSQIWRLQMNLKKKIGVVMMFGCGIVVTVVAVIRLKSLVEFAKTRNPTWDNYGAFLWSIVELQVGVVCICIPAMRLGFTRLFSKTTNRSYQWSASGGGGGGGSGQHDSKKSVGMSAGSRRSRLQVEDHDSFVQLVDVGTKGSTNSREELHRKSAGEAI